MGHCAPIKVMLSNNMLDIGPYNETLQKKSTPNLSVHREKKRTKTT